MAHEQARHLLEQLQKSAIATLPTLRPETKTWAERLSAPNVAQRVALLQYQIPDLPPFSEEEYNEQLRRSGSFQVSSKFEEPSFIAQLGGLIEALEWGAKRANIDLPTRPFFGTLRTGQVNAMTIPVPGSAERIIAFETEMFYFSHLLSKAISQAFPLGSPNGHKETFSTDLKQIKKEIKKNQDIVHRFTDVVVSYCITGRPSIAEPYAFIQPKHHFLSELLGKSCNLFVLGHEYGHLIRGHLDSATAQRVNLLGKEVAEISYSWNREFEADLWGMALMIPSMSHEKDTDLALSFWGADFFFSCVDVMDRATSLICHGSDRVKTLGSHPPAHNRRAFIREALERLVAPENPDDAKGAISLARTLEETVEILFSAIRPTLLKLHKKQVPVAKQWRQI